MSEQHEEPNKAAKAKPTRPTLPDPGRRRFARAGLAAPVILTMASKPSLATNLAFNCTLSGWTELSVSAAPSMQGTSDCGFNSPGPWKKTSTWGPTGIDPTKTLFYKGEDPWKPGIFSTQNTYEINGKVVPTGQGVTLIQVMHDYSGSFAWYTVAALGNSLTTNYPLSTQQVIDIYDAVAGGGSYITPGGAVMDIVDAMNFYLHIQHNNATSGMGFYYTPPAGMV